ncbi:alkaline phosphatase D family protein [Bacillus sp. F19]|nr:alkaline phosphatase D family protein [Bacillus sp. F19]
MMNLDHLKSGEMDRRSFLSTTSRLAVLSLGLTISSSLVGNRSVEAAPQFKDYPFTLGVASGEPLPDGIVLWTRLAPDPLNGGGMKSHDVPVRWEVALDESFKHVVKHGVEYARPELGHSIHVEVEGLESNHVYYYRFKSGPDISPIGRTKTTPAFGEDVAKMTFAFASCQHYQEGYFTAYRHMAKEDLDLVVHLGDYIYEAGPMDNAIRKHNGPEIITLDDYRNRYALYKSDADLRAAHEAFPWLVSMDDHEVENNWAGGIPEQGQSVEDFVLRRAAAFQAFYEHMPLRRSALPNGASMQLYRRLSYGKLIDFHALDTRQYRDDQANGDGFKPPSSESMDPKRTMIGAEQERWLLKGLGSSKAAWNVLAQQVYFSYRDYSPAEDELFNMDTWDGYPASRERILDFVQKKGIFNFVVLTGDVHQHWASEIKASKDPESETIGVEFVGSSITSGFDGTDEATGIFKRILAANPQIKFFNNQRGYVRCTVTPDNWQSDYMVLPYVSRPDAPISTRVSFLAENGKPGLTKIYDALVTTP